MNAGSLLLSGNADGGERFPAVTAGCPSDIATATHKPPSTLHNADDLLMNGEPLGREIRCRILLVTSPRLAHRFSGSGYGRVVIDWEGTTPAHDCQRGRMRTRRAWGAPQQSSHHAYSGHAGWLPRRTRELCCGAPPRVGNIDKHMTRVLSSQMHTLTTGNKPIAVPEGHPRPARRGAALRRAGRGCAGAWTLRAQSRAR